MEQRYEQYGEGQQQAVKNRWNIDVLLELFRASGEIALRNYEHPQIEVKADHSAVTNADREIERLFAARLDRPAEGSRLLGEETVDSRDEAYIAAALAEECFILDPIDGTAPYAAGVPLWGISLGLMREGALVEGAIYSPVRDEAFLSCRGTILCARNIRSGAPEIEPFTPVKAAYTPAIPVCVGQSAARNWEFTFPNQMFVWSACVAVYDGLLRGKLYGMIQFCKLWDMAGGFPLLKLAGFEARFADGRELGLDIVKEDNYFLARGPHRWRQKEHVVIAPDRKGTETIWTQVKVKNPL